MLGDDEIFDVPSEIGSENGFPFYNNTNYLKWGDRAIQLTESAKIECWRYKLDVRQIIDMLDDPVDCPQKRGFHKIDKTFKNEEFEICSKKDRRIFRIIYCADECVDVREVCWCIIHVKPT